MPTINLTDDELAAATAAIRRAIEDDRFPHAPRLDPLRAALGKFEAAPEPDPAPEGPAGSQSRQAGAAITGGHCAAMRYLKPSIHSVSACEPRPSAASIAALYPRNAWSLDMTLLVRGLSARSARKPATASAKCAHVYADERALFCPGQLFLTALHGTSWSRSLPRRGAGSPASKLLGSACVRFPWPPRSSGESQAFGAS